MALKTLKLEKRKEITGNTESRLLAEVDSFDHLIEKLSNGEESITSLQQGLSILSKVSDLKNNIGNAISSRLSQLIATRIKSTEIEDFESAILHLQVIYNKLLADEITLTSIVLGPDVPVQTRNELNLWKSDRHRGISTREEAVNSLNADGDWLIFYSIDDQNHFFLQKVKEKIVEVKFHPIAF